MHASRPEPDLATLSRRVRIHCLGTFSIADGDAIGQSKLPCPPKALALLQRLIACGLQGASAGHLAPALWPGASPRLQRRLILATGAALDEALATSGAIACDGDRLAVNETVIRVDSLALERALVPVLNPFRTPSAGECAEAQRVLLETPGSEFLPGLREPWTLAARMRISDACKRAAAVLLSLHCQPTTAPSTGRHALATNGEVP